MKVSEISLKHLPGYLLVASLIYLALPYVIFFAGWLRWYFAVLFIAVLLLGLYLAIRVIVKESSPSGLEIKPLHIAVVLGVSLALLSISGVGGIGYQDSDWVKHNTIFRDLVNEHWPVIYEFEGVKVPQVYYIAFYLPAALVGKLWGWALANYALFIWTWIGLLLSLVWFMVLVGRPYLSLGLFIAFSGLDALGQLTLTPLLSSFLDLGQATWDHIEWWAIGWQYPSNVTLLFWVPNQAICGWLVTAMVLEAILHKKHQSLLVLYFFLTALWSPFVSVGIAPYLVADFLTEAAPLPERIKKYISIPNICGGILLLLLLFFYSSRFYPNGLDWESATAHGFVFKFLNSFMEKVGVVVMIALFCLLEFGLYAFLIHKQSDYRLFRDVKTKGIFLATLLSLAGLPFYRYGFFNDMVMRSSIPALFSLAVFIGLSLDKWPLKGIIQIILVTLILMGSITPFVEVVRHIDHIAKQGTLSVNQEFFNIQGLLDCEAESCEDPAQIRQLLLQYAGSLQSPFFSLMAIK